MPRRLSSPQLIGRAVELERLSAGLEAAIAGEPGAVFLAGEAGVGKTRLVRELAALAREGGGRVLAGDCVELAGEDLPYTPLAAALRSLADELAADELREIAGSTWPALVRLVPALAVDDATSDEMSQPRLFELLLGLLERLARDRPLVLVLEDLHWADQSTRDFLSFLLRQLRSEAILLVATYRNDEVHRRHPLRPLLAEAFRLSHVERIELHRFTRTELAAQAEAITGALLTAGILDRLFERSEGNPFFAEELLVAHPGGDGPLPETLRDILLLRLEGVGPNAKRVLDAVAVAGRPASEELIAAASGLTDETVREGLLELVSSQLLVATDRGYGFRHALLREVAYDDLMPSERRALHHAFGAALEQHPELAASAQAPAGEAAYHWFAAHDNSRALPALVRAGSDAMNVAAFAEAARHFELALEVWEQTADAPRLTGQDHVDLLRMAADAADKAGHGRALAFAREALSEVAADDVLRRGVLLIALSNYAWDEGDVETARMAQVEALEVLPASPPSQERALAVAEMASLLMVSGENAAARACAEEAVELARAVGARAIEGHALNSLGVALASDGDFDEGLGHLELALTIARELGAGDDVMRAYTNISHLLREAGRDAESLDVKAEGLAAGRELGFERYWNAFLAAGAAHINLLLGDYAAAAAHVDYVLRLDPPAQSVSYAYGVRAAIKIVHGDLAGAEIDLDQAAECWGRDADIWLNRAPIAICRMELALAQRDFETGHEIARQALDRVPDGSSYRVEKFETLACAIRTEADRAEHARDTHDAETEADAIATADALIERIERAPTHLAPQKAHAAHAAAEAARARGSYEVDSWQATVAAFEPLQPRSTAYAQWRLAEALLRSGTPQGEAPTVLGDAARRAQALGDVGLNDEIAALARRARIRLDEVQEREKAATEAQDGPTEFGLTPREVDVLRLVAEGLTNREIGSRLFIAEKTASVHVSRILAKLGARSRVEAAGIAHRLGLVSTDP